MDSFRATNVFRGYYPPEVQALVAELVREYPHEILTRDISPGLDDFHLPIVEKLLAAHERDAPELSQFANCYPTAGAQEGIREYMTFLQSKGVKRVYMWNGDYEGYYDIAKTRSITAVPIDYDANADKLTPGYWFISNPSLRNGMIVPEEKLQDIMSAGHKIFYDLSCLGTTYLCSFDVSHPNIVAVAISFSAPYGLSHHRIGFTFTRDPIPSLTSNKLRMNIHGLLVAEKILDRLDQDSFAERYKAIQADVVERINVEYELGLSAADSFPFANASAVAVSRLPAERRDFIGKFRRGDWYRFCLTPYFADYETPTDSQESAPETT